MTTYAITSGAVSGAFYVVQTFEHGHTTHQDVTHGPYKNEESAKRRIRDLKRKEVEATTNLGDTVKPEIVTPLPAATKIAASSEYGKFKLDPVAFAAELAKEQPPIINRPIGCYPAISKHAYQR